MLEGVDRTVDLVGVRTSGLTGATDEEISSAVRWCDAAALARTDGHFAAIGRDGRTVRLAEITNAIGWLVRSNEVVYSNCFNGLRASIRYRNSRSGT